MPAQMAIAVYTNRDGNVVLRQEGDEDGDQFVWVRPEYVVPLAEAMLHEAGIAATIRLRTDEPLALPKPASRSNGLTGETLPLPLDGEAS